jgi:hypothetical protein
MLLFFVGLVEMDDIGSVVSSVLEDGFTVHQAEGLLDDKTFADGRSAVTSFQLNAQSKRASCVQSLTQLQIQTSASFGLGDSNAANSDLEDTAVNLDY